MSNTLYEQDFHAWAMEQAALLRAGKLDCIDVANLAEEIESMARSERRELVNRLTVVLLHLLKWQYQPALRGNSWRLTIEEQRDSLAEHLRGGPAPARDALFWHYPHYHPGGATPYSAVRMGDWKLLHFYEDDRVELYDVVTDIGETTDLAAKEPQRVATMRARLDQWRSAIGAQHPTPNPAYDAEADKPKKKAAK